MSRFLLGCIEKTIANAYGSDARKGLSYINIQENDKKILLFVREKPKNQNGSTFGYVFIVKLILGKMKAQNQ